MGRKPNQLIADFFSRGEKIGDNSNRYIHTCKRCNEVFPRGRMEALTAHLSKKCPALTKAERATIVLRLHNLDPDDGRDEINDNPPLPGTSRRMTPALNRGALQEDLVGLNALAEASRQVGANNTQSLGGYAPADQVLPNTQHLPLDPQLEADVFDPAFIEEDMALTGEHHGLSASTGSSYPPHYSFVDDRDFAGHDTFSASLLTTLPPQLNPAMTTTSAGFEPDIGRRMLSADAPPLPPFGPRPSHPNPPAPEQQSNLSWVASQVTSLMNHTVVPPQSAADGPDGEHSFSKGLRPLAMNPNGPTMRVDPQGKIQKPKTRGRFAPERRAEIRELRKLGACMRCRILKKTCSPGTPCQACAAVGSPRVWKHSCVRAKLVEVIPTYNILLHAQVAHHEITTVNRYATVDEGNLSLAAYLFPDSERFVFQAFQTEARLRVKSSKTPSTHPAATKHVWYISTDADVMADKTQAYIRHAYTQIVAHEQSPMIRAALEYAATLCATNEGTSPAAESDEGMIANAVELWAMLAVLVDPSLSFQFSRVTDGDEEALGSEEWAYSHYVMNLQIRGSLERRMSYLSRRVMNELEQRILSRNKSVATETLLAAFLLLNGTERLMWLYRTWEDEERRPSEWPFARKPASYAETGETLAQAIHTFLNLRQVGPAIVIDPVTGTLIPRDSADGTLALWLGCLGLSADSIATHVANASFDREDCRSLDGTLALRLLTPAVDVQPNFPILDTGDI